MDFNPNKIPIKIIKEGAFGGTYFRDIYSNINKKWYKNSWKEFIYLKNIDFNFYASDYYDVNVNRYGGWCGTSLRFWENKGGWLMRMRNENEKWKWEIRMRNEKWEWEMRTKNEKWDWEMRIKLWIKKKKICLINCQINIK